MGQDLFDEIVDLENGKARREHLDRIAQGRFGFAIGLGPAGEGTCYLEDLRRLLDQPEVKPDDHGSYLRIPDRVDYFRWGDDYYRLPGFESADEGAPPAYYDLDELEWLPAMEMELIAHLEEQRLGSRRRLRREQR